MAHITIDSVRNTTLALVMAASVSVGAPGTALADPLLEEVGNRPLILQKAGGLQGTFSYIAFAPTRGVAIFVSINEFNFGAAMAMGQAANEMIATLAPR